VHSAHRGPDGGAVRTGQDDRLVVLFSHHGTGTLDNTRGAHAGPGGEPLIGAVGLLDLLHRFPNVVLWLNGHTHINAVRPHHDPADGRHGFWEVTTCAVLDWPCQTRLVEIVDHGDYLSIVTTMVDHDTPLVPAALENCGSSPRSRCSGSAELSPQPSQVPGAEIVLSQPPNDAAVA
jgi:hypothetical protein